MFERSRVIKMAGALAIVAAAVLLLSALAGAGVQAKGDHTNQGHGGNTQTITANCAATPNPASLYSQVSITGSGFAANTFYSLAVTAPSGTVALTSVGSDGSGNFSTTYNTVWSGTNTVNVFGSGVSATCTFSVN